MDFRTLVIAGLTGALAATVTADRSPQTPDERTVLGTLSELDGEPLGHATSYASMTLGEPKNAERPRNYWLSLDCKDGGQEGMDHLWRSAEHFYADHLKPEDEIPPYLHRLMDCKIEDIARYNRIKWMLMTGASIVEDSRNDVIVVTSARGSASFRVFHPM